MPLLCMFAFADVQTCTHGQHGKRAPVCGQIEKTGDTPWSILISRPVRSSFGRCRFAIQLTLVEICSSRAVGVTSEWDWWTYFQKINPGTAVAVHVGEKVHVNLQPRGLHGVPPSYQRYAASLQSMTCGTVGPSRMPRGQRAA